MLEGLSGWDDSQYREWRLANEPDTDHDEEHGDPNKLSYHNWGQETRLMLDIRNMVASLTNMHVDTERGDKTIDMLTPPGSPEEHHSSGTTFGELLAMTHH
ncbi:MAG: hypothetical protein J6575_03465 [Bifidobacterium sp.]|nr:hypothetical protein [Bifidobacterium sp.]